MLEVKLCTLYWARISFLNTGQMFTLLWQTQHYWYKVHSIGPNELPANLNHRLTGSAKGSVEMFEEIE